MLNIVLEIYMEIQKEIHGGGITKRSSCDPEVTYGSLSYSGWGQAAHMALVVQLPAQFSQQ